jgi:hypothetical protein
VISDEHREFSAGRREVFRRLKAPRHPVMPVTELISHKVIECPSKKRVTLEEKIIQEIREYSHEKMQIMHVKQ